MPCFSTLLSVWCAEQLSYQLKSGLSHASYFGPHFWIFAFLQDMPVKYLTLKDADEIVALVRNGEQSKPSLDNKAEEVYEEEEEEEGVENENNEQGN